MARSGKENSLMFLGLGFFILVALVFVFFNNDIKIGENPVISILALISIFFIFCYLFGFISFLNTFILYKIDSESLPKSETIFRQIKSFKEWIRRRALKRRINLQEKGDTILYRTLGPLKFISILALSSFLLVEIFGPSASKNNDALVIFGIIFVFNVFYSFDFLLIIIYFIVSKKEDI